MRGGRKFTKRKGCSFRLFQVGVLALALILFRHEISLILQWASALVNFVADTPAEVPPASDLLRETLYVLLNLASYVLFAAGVIYIIGGHILPLRDGSERWEAMHRFYGFFTGERRPVIRMREGQIVTEMAPGQSLSGGIALVDPNSAIVLERMSAPLSSQHPLARVGRPGVVFIQRGERLRGVVSLRNQHRAIPEVMVQTSEGIELKTTVSVTFTLGSPASVIKAAYIGEHLPFNLRVLYIDAASRQITAISDELDEEDKREIHRYAQQFLTFSEPPVPLEPDDIGLDHPPYTLDDHRIFSAVYSNARNPSQDRIDQWTDLPAMVAAEILRNIISLQAYDELFVSDPADMYSLAQRPPGKFRLQTELKPDFSRRLRYLGVMSYQVVQHKSDRSPAVGKRMDSQALRVSPVQKLNNSKVLRDRGIKVISAGFSELTPTDPKVYQQRLEYWRARWQQQMDQIYAETDRAVQQIKNQARAEAHREMTEKLNNLLQNKAISEEALAMRMYQILQEVAAQPATREILHTEAPKLMQTLAAYLLPEAQPQAEPQNKPPALGSGDLAETDDKK